MLGTKNSLRHVAPRLWQIAQVLRRRKVLGVIRGTKHLPPPRAILETFQDLGVTFLKFGQVLAMRTDLLPPEYTEQLKLLHDQVPPMDSALVRAAVESQLGGTLEELFTEFNVTPIAAATIAQVHEATTRDGRHVAVKVQRPGLEPIIATDIAVLGYLATLGSRLAPSLRRYDLPGAVAEFSKSLNRELDFGREARAIVLFRAALADVPDLWIPGVVLDYTKGTVLTLEFSAGERIDLYVDEHPEEGPRLINTLVVLMLQTIFEEGVFHADPHPGNVFVLPDGRLSLLDFGNTGDLDAPTLESLVLLLEAVVKGDGRSAAEAYLELARAGESVDHAGLLVDIKAALYEINRSGTGDVSIAAAFDSLLSAGTRNGVHNSPEIILLTRAFVILESMSRQLAPEHNYVDSFRTEATRLTAQHFSPARLKDQLTKIARDMERLVAEAPSDTRRILKRLAEGHGMIQAPGLEALGDRVSDNLERLAGAMASAAMIVGGAILLFARLGGWLDIIGQVMVVLGFLSMVLIRVGTFSRRRRRLL